MDELLKARKMSSASARRRKIQAQEEEDRNMYQRHLEHKRRVMLYDNLAEQLHSPTDSDFNDDSESGHDRQESVTTPSECSVVTPNDTPSVPSAFEKIRPQMSVIPEKPQLRLELSDTPASDTETILSNPSPVPRLQASLVALSDFTYDRFSTILDSPTLITSPDETTSMIDLDFDDYSPSPVETATPISICALKTRASVISISGRSSKKRRTLTAQSPLVQEASQETVLPVASSPPSPPPRSARRLSSSSARSGFLASEAQVMTVPDLPSNASSIIASASRDSVIGPLNGDSMKSMQRKSSQPLLSSIRSNHARMSSIKSLIRSPTPTKSASPTPSSRPESRSSRPPTSAADVMNDAFQPFETVPANLNDPPNPSWTQRPQTSHRPSRPSMTSTISRQHSVTALPTLPTTGNTAQSSNEPDAHPGSMRRKKSFSTLRKRSESIGQAIKFVASKTKSTAGHTPKLSQQYPQDHQHYPKPPPIPQAPAVITHRADHGLDLSSFPTPPLPSPRGSISAKSLRSRKSYTMFPPSPQIGSAPRSGVGIGLGVRI